MSKRERGAPASPGAPDLDGLQPLALMSAAGAAFVYLIRLSGTFPHPVDHLAGIGCWGVMLVAANLRLAWERKQGNYPARWGGVLVLVLAIFFSFGLLAEIAVATSPDHSQNQSGSPF